VNQKFGFILYENAQPIDIIGPWEVFSFWKQILNAPIELYLIAEKEGPIQLDNQITLPAQFNFGQAPKLDVLIVPGGKGRVKQSENEEMIAYIQKTAESCEYVISICTGMFLLAKAGLLKNHSVTTYWRAFSELKAHQDLKVEEERIVKTGRVWTSGGVTSGIDLALAFIEELAGKKVAGQVQLLLEYFPTDPHYCTRETASELPPYQGSSGTAETYLPKYIRDHLK